MTEAQETAKINLTGMRASVTQLTDLLNMLYGRPESPDMITLEDVKRRYPLTALGKPAMAAIDQSRRIVRAIGDFEKIGQCEFHIGLIFLHWGDCRGAAQQFMEARQQWSFTNHTAAVCLAHFAAGLAQQHVFELEKAMRQFGKATHLLPRIPLAPITTTSQFVNSLEIAVAQAQKELREDLWPPALMQSETEATPPQSRLGVTELPTLPDIPANGRLHWFRVIQPMSTAATHIKEGDWLLFQSTLPDYTYAHHESIVITSDVMIGNGVRLAPNEPSDSKMVYFLAQALFEGKLADRTAVPVQFVSAHAVEVAAEMLVGTLVGTWRPSESIKNNG